MTTMKPKFIAAFYVFCIVMFSCVGDDGPSLGPAGAACEDNAECESDFCVTGFLDGQEILDGLCTNECSFEDPDSCAYGLTCLRYNPTGEHYCYELCASAADCRDGWTCTNLVVELVCTPPL